METSLKTKAVYVVVSILVSGFGIYCIVAPVDQQAKSLIKAHLESPKHGPFDEAMAKSAGMEDVLAKKPKWKSPQPSPLKFDQIDPNWFQNRRPSFSSVND